MFYWDRILCVFHRRVGVRAFVASGFTHSPVCL